MGNYKYNILIIKRSLRVCRSARFLLLSQYVLFFFLVPLLSELTCTGLVTSETTNQDNMTRSMTCNIASDSVAVHLAGNFDPKEHVTVPNYVNNR
jgi:hypothetical protein